MGYFLGCVLTKAAAALPFIIQSPPFRLAGKRAEEVCALPVLVKCMNAAVSQFLGLSIRLELQRALVTALWCCNI